MSRRTEGLRATSRAAAAATDAAVRSGESPPRTVAQLDEPGMAAEPALRVRGARVVMADYRRLWEDFPSLAPGRSGGEGDRAARRETDAWLLRHAALISAAQAAQAEVNTPIPTEGPPVTVHRRPLGGRVFLAEVEGPSSDLGNGSTAEPAGLLDLKGVGVAPARTPRFGPYHDGLFCLGEAIEEVLAQRLVDRVLAHAAAGHRTVPWYALLDLGFDVRSERGCTLPAAVLVRRAHLRGPAGREVYPFGSRGQEVLLELELLLRRYGVTSSGLPGTHCELVRAADGTVTMLSGGAPRQAPPDRLRQLWRAVAGGEERYRFDLVNLQAARGAESGTVSLFDFGHYSVRDRFHLRLLSQVLDRPFRWGGTLEPDSPHFPQPDPELAIDAAGWRPRAVEPRVARRLGLGPAALLSPMELLAVELADGFRGGAVDGDEVLAAVDGFLRRHLPPALRQAADLPA